jgi:hypothetical protein
MLLLAILTTLQSLRKPHQAVPPGYLWSQYQGAGLSSEGVLASSFVEASAALVYPVINLVPFGAAHQNYDLSNR